MRTLRRTARKLAVPVVVGAIALAGAACEDDDPEVVETEDTDIIEDEETVTEEETETETETVEPTEGDT